MALVTVINIDLLNQIATLNCSVDGSVVDMITYNNVLKTVTFDERGEITITLNEFIDFCNQINIFQTAIIFNFNTNIFLSLPFTQMITNELHESGTWSLVVTAQNEPNVCDYTYTLSLLQIYINKRNGSKTLGFPEWLYFINQLVHYKTSVKQY